MSASRVTSPGTNSPEQLLRVQCSPLKTKLSSSSEPIGGMIPPFPTGGFQAPQSSTARSDNGPATSSRSSVFAREIPNVHPFLSRVGKLAGVACGAIDPDELLGRKLWGIRGRAIHHLTRGSIRLLFTVLSLLVTIILLPGVAWDSIHIVYFWSRSIAHCHANFLIEGEETLRESRKARTRADKELASSGKTFPNDIRPVDGWHCTNPVSDIAFIVYTGVLHLLRTGSLITQSLPSFREYLAVRPPDFPISANDDIYRYDRAGDRFQLPMLFVVDKVEYEEFKNVFRRRWVDWEMKTRSIVCQKYGRSAWHVLQPSEFNVEDHILHRKVDLTKKTLAEVVSEMGNNEMPMNRPQWQVWFVEAEETCDSVDLLENMPRINGKPITSLTYICCKWNHIYSDGVGMMMSIVKRIGDEKVTLKALPEQYRRRVPWWQQILYYAWHSLRASLECSQHILYFLYGIQHYPALITPFHDADPSKPPGLNTGRKHYSAPAIVSMDQLDELRLKMQAEHIKMIAERHELSRSADENTENENQSPFFPCCEEKKHLLNNPDLLATQYKPIKPTINDILCYCLCNAFSQLKCPARMEELVRKALDLNIPPSDPSKPHKWNQEFVNVIIPMMCRVSVPTRMDNFTALVSGRFPLPRPRWMNEHADVDTSEAEKMMSVERLLHIKRTLDNVKYRNCRTTLFLTIVAVSKALPTRWTEQFFFRMYEHMQFCSTNVAAPAIESSFIGRKVHGLFFWPAIPPTATGGSAWVSLGREVQVLTVVEECELVLAVDIATALLQQINLFITEDAKNHLLSDFADLLPRLIKAECTRLFKIFQVEDTPSPASKTEVLSTSASAS